MNLKMEQFILGNGKKDKEMGKVNSHGQMEVIMKDIGEIIRLPEKVDLYIQMEMYMKVSGIKIKVFIFKIS
jgi:hypothetical protein